MFGVVTGIMIVLFDHRRALFGVGWLSRAHRQASWGQMLLFNRFGSSAAAARVACTARRDRFHVY